MFPRNENRNEGIFAKPPFYATALLSPGEEKCAFEVSPLFLPLAITAFRGPQGHSSLAIIAFGAFESIVPKSYCRLGKLDKRSLDSLI